MTKNKLGFINRLRGIKSLTIVINLSSNRKQITINKTQGLLCGIILFILFYFFSVIRCSYTPFRDFLPGYVEFSTKAEVIQNNVDMDSLYLKSRKIENYMENLRRILNAEVEYALDQEFLIPSDTLIYLSAEDLPGRTDSEIDFIKNFEEEEKYNLSELISHNAAEGLSFISPVKGVINKRRSILDTENTLEILCARNALVSNPLEGVMINTDYTIKDKYAIVVLHKNNFISIFKNIPTLRKNIGEKILTGEIIGVMSTKSQDETQPQLIYELWHNGNRVNPEEYINF